MAAQDAVAARDYEARSRPNPKVYTRDTGFLDDIMLRKKVRVRSEAVRPWESPHGRKPGVFGAVAQFHADAVVKTSGGAVRMRGMSSNDLLFNFDEVPVEKGVDPGQVARLRRADACDRARGLAAAGAPAVDDGDGTASDHSDAESVRERRNLRLPGGFDRWATAKGNVAQAEGPPPSPVDIPGSRQHACTFCVVLCVSSVPPRTCLPSVRVPEFPTDLTTSLAPPSPPQCDPG